MKAIGKNIHGEALEFESNSDNGIMCVGKELVELMLPEGIEKVYCYKNQLTHLIIPDSVKYLSCHHNKLTGLILPRTMVKIWCDEGSVGNLADLKSSMIKIFYFK